MRIPKTYKNILDNLNEKYNFFYLDSLIFIMLWREENKLEFKKWNGVGLTKYTFFRKYVATLVESFYENKTGIDHEKRKFLELGYKFADWLLKTPIDFNLPVCHHAEINKDEYSNEA